MRIFLDTANIDEIREVARWGILSGVTTNPTLMMKSRGKSHKAVSREIAEIVAGPISAETVSLETAGIATAPCKVLEAAAKHPLADKGIETFLKDWREFMQESGGKGA
jgi:transaldolase